MGRYALQVSSKDSCLAKDPPQGILHLMTGLLGGIRVQHACSISRQFFRTPQWSSRDLCWGDIALWLLSASPPAPPADDTRACPKEVCHAPLHLTAHNQSSTRWHQTLFFLNFLTYVCMVGGTQTEKILYFIVNFLFISLFCFTMRLQRAGSVHWIYP